MSKNEPQAQDRLEAECLSEREGKLNKGKNQQIEIDSLVPFSLNARTPEEIQPEGIAGLMERNGYDISFPLTVSKRADGTVIVLRGNRRLAAMLLLRNSKPETYAKTFPKGTAPAIVLTGLTLADEVSINADHAKERDRQPLSAWGIFLQIKALMEAGEVTSRFAIADKLGLKTVTVDKAGQKQEKLQSSMVQDRMNLAKLPTEIQTAFRGAAMFGGSDNRLKSEQIKQLYTAHLADREENAKTGTLIGANLAEKWAAILASEAATTGRKAPSAKTVTSKAETCTSGIVKAALQYAIGDVTADSLTSLIATATAVESDSATLAMIREYLGAGEFAELVDAAQRHRAPASVEPASVEPVAV